MIEPRFELWSDTTYLSTGKILGILTNVIRASERIEVNGPETLSVTIPSTADSLIEGDRIIRVVEESGDWAEWRVDKLTRTRSAAGSFTQVDALGIKSDMSRFSPIVTTLQANSERWTHIEWVGLSSTELWEAAWNAFGDDPDTVSYFDKGTVTFANSSVGLDYDLVFDWETQGSALQELATVIGLELELSAGTTAYTVNLTTGINSTKFAPLIAFRKNERGIRYVEDHGKIASRIYPRGLGDSAYKPTIGDLVLDFTTAPPPYPVRSGFVDIGIFEDDQLNGLFLESLVDGSIAKIEDSFAGNPGSTASYINYTSTQTPTGGPHFLRVSSTGERLIYVPRASSVEGRMRPLILDRQDIPVITNVFSSGVNPSGSTVGGPNPFVHNGTESALIGMSFDSAVFFTRPLEIRLSDDRPHLSMQTHFYLEHGTVGVTFEVFSGTAGGSSISVEFPSSTAGGADSARASAGDTWHDIAVAPGAFDMFELFGTSTLNARVKYKGLSTGVSSTATVVYVDAIQVVNSPVPADQIVDGSAPRKLWNAAVEVLRSGIENPLKNYDVQAIDLGRLDTVNYPSEAFLPGGNVTLFDPGLGITDTRRICSRRRNLLVEGDTVLELSDG